MSILFPAIFPQAIFPHASKPKSEDTFFNVRHMYRNTGSTIQEVYRDIITYDRKHSKEVYRDIITYDRKHSKEVQLHNYIHKDRKHSTESTQLKVPSQFRLPNFKAHLIVHPPPQSHEHSILSPPPPLTIQPLNIVHRRGGEAVVS